MELTELSKDILNNLYLKDQMKLEGDFQVTEIQTANISSSANKKPKCWISDGIYKMEFYMLDSVSLDFIKEISPKDFVRAQIMYVSKLRGGVLIKYERIQSKFQGIVGDPVAIVEEGIVPNKNDKGSNKLIY